jgi:uncharacterized zinc-type alcohol dehydrogenase-like protein
MVPGHEIIGRVTRVGEKVTKLAVGDLAGVGCMVDSCRVCPPCRDGNEQFCQKMPAFTYNGTEMDRKTPTYGGYSTHIVTTQSFVLKVPPALDPAKAAPLLCAGITTYSPLRRWKVKKGSKLGVLGLGGLGHMAVKIGAALGAEVTVLSSSPEKESEARRLGASRFALTSDKEKMRGLSEKLDFIIDTVSGDVPWAALFDTLRPEGKLVVAGVPASELKFGAFPLIMFERALVGGRLGSAEDTRDMLAFSAAQKIKPMIETFPMKELNKALDHVRSGKARYRAVLTA